MSASLTKFASSSTSKVWSVDQLQMGSSKGKIFTKPSFVGAICLLSSYVLGGWFENSNSSWDMDSTWFHKKNQQSHQQHFKTSLLSIWNLSAICCEKWQTCMQLDELKYKSSQWYWCMLENQEVKTVGNTDSPFVAEMVGWSRKFATLRGYLAGPANPKEIKESQQKLLFF